MEAIKKILEGMKPEDLAEYVKQAKELLGLTEIEKRLTAIEETQARLASVLTALAKPAEAPAEVELPQNPFTIPPEVLTAFAKILEGGGKSEFDRMVEFVTKARAVADALNPPSVWDRIFPQVIVRSFLRAGLITQEESKAILREYRSEGKDWERPFERWKQEQSQSA